MSTEPQLEKKIEELEKRLIEKLDLLLRLLEELKKRGKEEKDASGGQ